MGIFGSIGKLLLGSKKTTTTKGAAEPWKLAIPQLTDFLGDTSTLYNGSTPLFSPQEQQGYQALTGAVNAGQPLMGAGNEELQNTVNGQYLTPETNPYLADIARRIGGEAGAGVNATFGGRGRSGSGLAGYYSGKGIADAIGGVLGGAYDNERNRQLAAAGMIPGQQAASLVGPSALIEAGKGITARPYDINTQRGGVLAQIGNLGQQTTGSTTAPKSGGLLRTIGNSFVNQLFPNGGGNAF